MNEIVVEGFTVTPLLDGHGQRKQYVITISSHGRYQEYIFTPNRQGTFDWRVNCVPYPDFAEKCAAPTMLQWRGSSLYCLSKQQCIKLYDINTKEFVAPDTFCETKPSMPPRTVMIVTGCYESVLPLLAPHLQVALVDTWTHLPSIIPEDVIAMKEAAVPIEDIMARIPPNTRLIHINAETYLCKNQ